MCTLHDYLESTGYLERIPRPIGPTNAAQVKTRLEEFEGKIEVVAIHFSKNFDTSEFSGRINFEPTLRNITSCGPRNDWDWLQLIYANEEYEDSDISLYNGGPELQLTDNSLEECLNVTRRLHEVLPTTPFRYTFSLQNCEGEEMKAFVSRCLVGSYEKVTFCGRFRRTDMFNPDEFDFLMNIVNSETYFEFNCEVPDGFRHEKAFQFKSFFYHHAHWITLDDLKSLRNHNIVRLGRTNFSNEDVNEFLKSWAECDEPMMNIFSVYLRTTFEGEGDKCDRKIILAGLEHFSTMEQPAIPNNPLIYYIKSRMPGKCGELQVHERKIELHTRTTTDLPKEIQQEDNDGFELIGKNEVEQ
ncbi:unnamed protein product [Caenorhabditis brenneri]